MIIYPHPIFACHIYIYLHMFISPIASPYSLLKNPPWTRHHHGTGGAGNVSMTIAKSSAASPRQAGLSWNLSFLGISINYGYEKSMISITIVSMDIINIGISYLIDIIYSYPNYMKLWDMISMDSPAIATEDTTTLQFLLWDIHWFVTTELWIISDISV